jgi:hypothetical protein
MAEGTKCPKTSTSRESRAGFYLHVNSDRGDSLFHSGNRPNCRSDQVSRPTYIGGFENGHQRAKRIERARQPRQHEHHILPISEAIYFFELPNHANSQPPSKASTMMPIITPMIVLLFVLWDKGAGVMPCVEVKVGRMIVAVERGGFAEAAVRSIAGVSV